MHQDVKSLPALFRLGPREYMGLVRAGSFTPAGIDHVLCHYSAEHFRREIFALLREADLMIDEERSFTNLHTRGNTGAASIFVMLEEAWRSGWFAPGERILLIVPESGRYCLAFAQLACVAAGDASAPPTLAGPPVRTGCAASEMAVRESEVAAAIPSPLGAPRAEDGEVVRWTVLELARVWGSFEQQVRATPLVCRINTGTATLADYRRLLLHLRQQVVGGSLKEIRSARKNIGSEALSAYVFHQASQSDPVDPLGATFVIEGLGTSLALSWAWALRKQCALRRAGAPAA